MALWGGRFDGNVNDEVTLFTESVSYDKRLYKYDIQGSKAHVEMLAESGIIPKETAVEIQKKLTKIEADIDAGNFEFKPELEDIHMHIETALIKELGDEGARVHTARSRNDQVAVDVRMYVRDEIQTLLDKLKHFQKVLVKLAKDNSDAILPGFTHLQHAQPVLFSHHILAYVEMFSRDYDRLKDCLKRVNVMPLGSGALAGSTLPINREITAKILNFPEISRNSMDAVADRDYMCELLSAFAVFAMHISRLSEDMILWCSQEFDFIVLSDAFTTGSSLMPQKKNPDICEISRGKTARIYGSLTALLTMCKGLPLTYNRDLQEDKEPLFDAIDTVNRILNIYPPMMEEMKLNKDKMLSAATDPLLMATDLAEELVKLGVPFRTAHHRVGALVKWCEDNKTPLNEVTLEQMLEVIPEATESCLNIYSPKISVAKRDVIGGTAPVQVLKQIEFWENELA